MDTGWRDERHAHGGCGEGREKGRAQVRSRGPRGLRGHRHSRLRRCNAQGGCEFDVSFCTVCASLLYFALPPLPPPPQATPPPHRTPRIQDIARVYIW